MPPIESPEFLRTYELALMGRLLLQQMDLDGGTVECEKILKSAVRRAATRKRSKSIEFEITPEWAIKKMRNQEYTCALTGIRFSPIKTKNSYMRPFAPSLDRIDPAKGYVPGNVRIVLFGINVMLSDWGEEVFQQISNAYAQMKNKNPRTESQIPELEKKDSKNKQ